MANPAFRTAAFGQAPARKGQLQQTLTAEQLDQLYGRPAAGPVETDRMSLDDVIVKTLVTLGVLLVGAVIGFFIPVLYIPFIFVGLALALVNIFKKQVSPGLVMAYAAAQGVFLGTISAVYEGQYRGIVVQAIVGTAAVFGAVLLGYKSGRLRATPTFVKVVTFGLVGLVAVMLINLLVGAFTSGDPLGISGGNTGLSILFTAGLIVFGALTFVLDFDQADAMIAAGVPERESWRVGFGLVVGLVFLYLNILRLLSYLQGND